MASIELQTDQGDCPADVDAFRREAAAHNVNEETLLATDYLNHFNEVAMILELVADCPDCIDEAKDWRPKSYEEHFRDSGFSAKDFVIAAYAHAPACYRQPFDATIAAMNEVVLGAIGEIDNLIHEAGPDQVRVAVQSATAELNALIERASAIIHGANPTMNQTAVDTILEGDQNSG